MRSGYSREMVEWIEEVSLQEMVALSGAHTLGQAQCQFFCDRVNTNGSQINAGFASMRRRGCPSNNGNTNLAPLDLLPWGVLT
ncbi:hypothetical protein QQ045_017398 [Rhodiola kirilowii]